MVIGTGLIQLRRVGKDETGCNYPVVDFRVSGNKIQVVENSWLYTQHHQSLWEGRPSLMCTNERFNPEKPDHEEV